MSRLWLLLSVLMLSIFTGLPGPITSAEANPPFCCWKLLKEDVASQLCIYDCPQEGYPDCQYSINTTTRQFTLLSSCELISQTCPGGIPGTQCGGFISFLPVRCIEDPPEPEDCGEDFESQIHLCFDPDGPDCIGTPCTGSTVPTVVYCDTSICPTCP